MRKSLVVSLVVVLMANVHPVPAADIVYIHGRVSDNGQVLNQGQGDPFDQMLLDDSGSRGLSDFVDLVEGQGHSIIQVRDQLTTLDAAFLNDYDVVIFGLHQKNWSASEKAALDTWLRAGGGMFIYSDSASGGLFSIVGAQNPVGQTVTNNLISQYGMQVTVDQADGTNSQTALSSLSISAIQGLSLEGEGVSPIAVAPNDPNVEILIPYNRNQNPLIRHTQGITISNPVYASMVRRPIGQGDIVVMFDRQPMWNRGPGSDIRKKDNAEILREVVNFLALRPAPPEPPTPPTPPRGDSRGTIPAVILLLDDDA